MSCGPTLRALLNERLAAAAEDIFSLFEKTVVAYEEQLFRYKEENQRKQQLLDDLLNPRIEQVRGNFQIGPASVCPGLKHGIMETLQTEEEPEEQNFKQEEDQLPVCFPESSLVCVKDEESSLLQQRQTEQREEMQREDSESHFLSNIKEDKDHSSDTDNDDDWDPFGCSAAQIETEAGEDHYNQIQTRDRSANLSPQNKSVPVTTVHIEHMSGACEGGAERKKHQCSICNKRFERKRSLKLHMRVHTGEKPYSCTVCEKHFADHSNLIQHKRTHTGERPYSCPFCKKHFAGHSTLRQHIRIHTGEKPYSCSICMKHFRDHSTLRQHKNTHRRKTLQLLSL